MDLLVVAIIAATVIALAFWIVVRPIKGEDGDFIEAVPEVEPEATGTVEVVIEDDPEPLTRQLAEARRRLGQRRPPQPPRASEPIVEEKPAEVPPAPPSAPESAAEPPAAQPEPEAVEAQEEAPERPIRVVRPTGSTIAEGQAAVDWLVERGARGLSTPDADVAGLILSDVAGIVEINHEGGVLCLTYNPDPPPARAPERPAAQQRKATPKTTPQGKKPSDPNDPTDPTSPAFLKWNDPRRLVMEAEQDD